LPLPDSFPEPCRPGHPARQMLVQEIRGLAASPAPWILFVVVSLLVGYSFIQAVDLFARASRTARSYPELAAGMNPLDGIFVPTFGAYYLAQTLLLPFVAIRLIGLDKQSGVLKLLLQLPLSPVLLGGLKILAMGIVWGISMIPAGLALIMWQAQGGHVYYPEIAGLILGHGLYALTVITLAMFAAAITNALPTAAICCLSVTLGSWVIDFAAAGHGGLLGALGGFSLTSRLREFETGLLSLSGGAAFLLPALLFFSLTVIWLHPGRRPVVKIGKSLAVTAGLAIGAWIIWAVPGSLDVTENHRHSFSVTDTRALGQLSEPLTITVHLDPRDSRLHDLSRDLLGKLRRSVSDLKIKIVSPASGGMFQAAEDDKYGLIEITCHGKTDQSYSNSAGEILPIIYHLAGIQVVSEAAPVYPGYPLVTDAAAGGWGFYLLLPLLFAGAGIYSYRGKW